MAVVSAFKDSKVNCDVFPCALDPMLHVKMSRGRECVRVTTAMSVFAYSKMRASSRARLCVCWRRPNILMLLGWR